MEHYITEIRIDELRHLSNVKIELNRDKRTNLLLTGKNGSGKTSVLHALKWFLWSELCVGEPSISEEGAVVENAVNVSEHEKRARKRFVEYMKYLNGSKIHVAFNEKDSVCGLYKRGKYIIAFYGADRKISISWQNGVEDVILQKSYSLEENPGEVLLKYLVHLKTQQIYAKNEGDIAIDQMIETWFGRFVRALKVLLDNPDIELTYDYRTYNFTIVEKGRKPFGFGQLSDGYSAVLQIVADLILRMEQNWLKEGKLSSYDVEGIVLIDELETHLHIGLQRTILPFLTEFFPKIQFILSTHSPYILNSIENCIIYDLENHTRMENMSGYSAEGIVEGYFEKDAYSELLMKKVKRYEVLVDIGSPTDEERIERAKLKVELKQLSGDLSKEAKAAFDDIEQRRKYYGKI